MTSVSAKEGRPRCLTWFGHRVGTLLDVTSCTDLRVWSSDLNDLMVDAVAFLTVGKERMRACSMQTITHHWPGNYVCIMVRWTCMTAGVMLKGQLMCHIPIQDIDRHDQGWSHQYSLSMILVSRQTHLKSWCPCVFWFVFVTVVTGVCYGSGFWSDMASELNFLKLSALLD